MMSSIWSFDALYERIVLVSYQSAIKFRVECGLSVERGHPDIDRGLICFARECNEQWLDWAILGVESACGGADTFRKRPCEHLCLTKVQYTLVLSYASPKRNRVCVIFRSLPVRCDMLVQKLVELLHRVLRALRVAARDDDHHSRVRRPLWKLQTPRLLPLKVGLHVRRMTRGKLDEEAVTYPEPHPAEKASVGCSTVWTLRCLPVRAGDRNDELVRHVLGFRATSEVMRHEERGRGRRDSKEEHLVVREQVIRG